MNSINTRGCILAAATALAISAGQVHGQIVPDDNTQTTVITTVTTESIEDSIALNSFRIFMVNEDHTTHLVLPDAADTILNVVHTQPTIIDGTLRAINISGDSGQDFYLLNPNEIIIGPAAVVQGGNIFLSTPTQAFTNFFFDGPGDANDAALQSVLDQTLPINPIAQIIHRGIIDADLLTVNGSFNFLEGSISGSLHNLYSANLSGPGVRTVSGNLLNSARLSVNDTMASILGDLTIAPEGYLTGNAGAQFTVGGDFINSSMRPDEWNTELAELLFTAGAHDMYVVGDDLGPGGDNGFAWRMLTLGSPSRLTLFDGDSQPGGALYLDVLNLFSGLDQLTTITSYGITIYYDPTLPGNSYLAGGTYELTGGGMVAPIPEPATLGLLSIAALVLAPRRRRHRSSADNAHPRQSPTKAHDVPNAPALLYNPHTWTPNRHE